MTRRRRSARVQRVSRASSRLGLLRQRDTCSPNSNHTMRFRLSHRGGRHLLPLQRRLRNHGYLRNRLRLLSGLSRQSPHRCLRRHRRPTSHRYNLNDRSRTHILCSPSRYRRRSHSHRCIHLRRVRAPRVLSRRRRLLQVLRLRRR